MRTMTKKYAVAAIALILTAGAASAAQQCTISDGSRTGTVIANDWVAFFPESESGAAVPKENLIKKDRIFRDPSWRNMLKTVTAPQGCESVIWTKVSGGEKIGGRGTFNIPEGKNTASYMCRCR